MNRSSSNRTWNRGRTAKLNNPRVNLYTRGGIRL